MKKDHVFSDTYQNMMNKVASVILLMNNMMEVRPYNPLMAQMEDKGVKEADRSMKSIEVLIFIYPKRKACHQALGASSTES